MWFVDPSLLCNEHLQREHWEIHQLVDVLRGEWDVSDYAATMKVVGHAVRGQVFPRYVTPRHDRLATHIRERGIGHDSPLDYDPPVRFSGDVTESLVADNRRDLVRRCSKCADRIE